MTFHLIGTGVGGAKNISVNALETLKKCESVFLECYTNIARDVVHDFSKLGVCVKPVLRSFVEEKGEEVLFNGDTALIVIGHPLAATTHIDLILRAKEKKIHYKIHQNTSIFDAISLTGLQMYKFGKTTSIPFTIKTNSIDTPALVLRENQSIGAHTLFLLDLEPDKQRFLTIGCAISYLQRHKFNLVDNKTIFVGCARLGTLDEVIVFGNSTALKTFDFGSPPYCLIVPGKLHFMEEEALQKLAIRI